MAAIGVAMLGAGNFARDEHLPAIQACPLFSLKAIYSRSRDAAEKLANAADVDAYYDSSDRSLDELLGRIDIQAVTIALPILVQPNIIKRAIQAGKHVLSEKPIAKDVKTAVQLLEWYREVDREEIWSVGENFRFLENVLYGANQLEKMGGEVVTFGLRLFGFINGVDHSYQAFWRKDPDLPGGFLLDGGVHFVAGLRFLLAAAGQSITEVAAFTSLLQPRLPPVDTAHATMRISNGRNGTFAISFGAEFKNDFEIEVVTDKGAVTVKPDEVVVLARSAHEEGRRKRVARSFRLEESVRWEIAAFADGIRKGKPDVRGWPEQALADLMVLQAMLESGEQGGAVKSLRNWGFALPA